MGHDISNRFRSSAARQGPACLSTHLLCQIVARQTNAGADRAPAWGHLASSLRSAGRAVWTALIVREVTQKKGQYASAETKDQNISAEGVLKCPTTLRNSPQRHRRQMGLPRQNTVLTGLERTKMRIGNRGGRKE